MNWFRALLVAAVMAVVVTTGETAPPPPRPFAGIGILVIDSNRAPAPLVLYRERGTGRMATRAPAALAGLAPAVAGSGGEQCAAVVDKRGNWVRIVYDDAGRDGWLSLDRTRTFTRWEDYLQGASVRVLPGVKKTFTALREHPRDEAPAISGANGGIFRVAAVTGDWCKVLTPSGATAWLRWRDGDGRFLVAVDRTPPQKR